MNWNYRWNYSAFVVRSAACIRGSARWVSWAPLHSNRHLPTYRIIEWQSRWSTPPDLQLSKSYCHYFCHKKNIYTVITNNFVISARAGELKTACDHYSVSFNEFDFVRRTNEFKRIFFLPWTCETTMVKGVSQVYELIAGICVFAGKTWAWGTRNRALYKSTYLFLPLPLMWFCRCSCRWYVLIAAAGTPRTTVRLWQPSTRSDRTHRHVPTTRTAAWHSRYVHYIGGPKVRSLCLIAHILKSSDLFTIFATNWKKYLVNK